MIESLTGLDMDKDILYGYLYVASASNHTFTKFSRDGVLKLIKEIGGQGLDVGEIAHA